MDAIPVIDLSAFRGAEPATKRALADAVDAACQRIGFLLIAGHAVPAELIDLVRAEAMAFFSEPAAFKQRYRPPPGVMLRGYTPPETNTLALSRGQRTPPDFRELFSAGRPAVTGEEYRNYAGAASFYHPNIWPDGATGLRAAFEAYVAEMERLSRELMRVFALALDLEERFFDAKIDCNFSVLHGLHYGARTEPPLPGQLRAGAHSDFGSLTILHPPEGDLGLEVKSPAGEWIKVQAPPDTYVINIGDLMQQWTNDRWVSTMHRVINPTEPSGWAVRRLSLGYFCHPNYDAPLACLPSCVDAANPARYPATLAGEYMRGKIAAVRNAA